MHHVLGPTKITVYCSSVKTLQQWAPSTGAATRASLPSIPKRPENIFFLCRNCANNTHSRVLWGKKKERRHCVCSARLFDVCDRSFPKCLQISLFKARTLFLLFFVTLWIFVASPVLVGYCSFLQPWGKRNRGTVGDAEVCLINQI